MNEFLYQLGESLQDFGTGAYLIVSLIVVLETLVVIGQFVPGTFFLAFVGFLCYAQVFNFGSMLLSIYITHFLTEIVNYAIGRSKGRALFKPESRFFKPKFLEAAESRFRTSGGKMLIVGQFIGFLRPFFAIVAGATHYPLVRFLPIMAIGSLLWALVPLSIGFLAGASWEKAVHYLENFSLVLLIAIPSAMLAGWVIRRIARYSGDIGNLIANSAGKVRGTPGYQRLSTRHPHAFAFLENRLSFSQPWGMRASILLFASGCCFTFALMILADIKTNDNWKFFDLSVVNLLAQLRTPATDTIFLHITHLGSAPVVWVLLALVCGYCLYARQQRSCVVIIASIMLGLLFSQMLKFAYGRERPDISIRIIEAAGFSFPSGHSTVSIALFGSLYYWLWNHPGKFKLRTTLAFVLLLLALLVGFSRMYLGVHYPSDVTAGFALGTSAVLLAVAIGTNLPRLVDVPRRADIAMLVLLFVHFGAASLYAAWHPTRPPRVFADPNRVHHASSVDELLRLLPRDARSISSQLLLPLNVVAIGPLDPLAAELQSRGWKKIRPSDFFTRRISRPVFPAFVESKPSVASFEYETTGTRMVARFWAVDYMVTGSTVYVGAVSDEYLHNKFRSLQVYHLSPDVDLARDKFAQLLGDLQPREVPFRPRGQYNWKYSWFTHGGALVFDVTTGTAANRIDRSHPPASQS